MSNTHYATDGTKFVDLNNTVTSANAALGIFGPSGGLHTLGTRVQGNNDSKWTFVYASAALTQYAMVAIETSGTASMMLDTISRGTTPVSIGIAQVAFAAGDYGWVASEGNRLRVLTTTAIAGGARVYTTDTAGRITGTQATAANAEILGLKVTALTGAGASSTPAIAKNLVLAYPQLLTT